MKKEQWKIKIYVGEFNKFVLCDRGPGTEEYAHLDPFLEFLCLEDDQTVDAGTENGFYWAYLEMECGVNVDPEDQDAFLVIDRIEKCV